MKKTPKFGPFRNCLSAVALMGLAACGGGGDSGAPVTSTAKVEGVYSGTLTGSTSSAFRLLVLENDDAWALYGTQSSTTFVVAGFIQGAGASGSGRYVSSNAKDFGFSPAVSATIAASYDAPAGTVAGTVTSTAGTVTLAGGRVVGSLYTYYTPATLASIAGSWAASSTSGETVALTVAATGSFTAVSSRGCTSTGTVAARASGKNVYDVRLTAGPTPCASAGQTGSGIALVYPLTTGRTQLAVATTNSDRTLGAALFAVR